MTLASIIAKHGDAFSDQAKADLAEIEKLLGDTRDLESRIQKLEKSAPLESDLAELRRIACALNAGVPPLHLVVADKGIDGIDNIGDAERLGLLRKLVPAKRQNHVDPVASVSDAILNHRNL